MVHQVKQSSGSIESKYFTGAVFSSELGSSRRPNASCGTCHPMRRRHKHPRLADGTISPSRSVKPHDYVIPELRYYITV
jgi:hypothetical protein